MGAPTIDELTLAEEPAAWEALGFALDGESCLLGGVRIRFTGSGSGRGIVGWSLRDVRSTELDGLPTTASESPPPAEGKEAGTHPNGARAIDHVVAMTPFFERSVETLKAAGLDLRRVREQPTPAGAPRQAFFRLGREILELVQEPAEIVASAGEIRPAVQPGRRIATVRRSAGLTVPLALMSPDERAQAER